MPETDRTASEILPTAAAEGTEKDSMLQPLMLQPPGVGATMNTPFFPGQLHCTVHTVDHLRLLRSCQQPQSAGPASCEQLVHDDHTASSHSSAGCENNT